MTIRRGPKPLSNFTVLSNETFNAPLKADALGVWLHLLSKPEDWVVVPKVLQKQFGLGRDSLRRIFRELQDHGVMVRQPKRGEDGRVSGWEYLVFEEPQPKDGNLGARSTERLDNRKTAEPNAWKSDPLQRTDLLQSTDGDKAAPKPPPASTRKSHLEKMAERIAGNLTNTEAERAEL